MSFILQLKYKKHDTLRAKKFKEMISKGEVAGIALEKQKKLDKARVFNKENKLPND